MWESSLNNTLLFLCNFFLLMQLLPDEVIFKGLLFLAPIIRLTVRYSSLRLVLESSRQVFPRMVKLVNMLYLPTLSE